jgi:hypothetical protein
MSDLSQITKLAHLQDALRQLLASAAPSIQEQIVPTLQAALPQAMGSEVGVCKHGGAFPHAGGHLSGSMRPAA